MQVVNGSVNSVRTTVVGILMRKNRIGTVVGEGSESRVADQYILCALISGGH